MLIKMRIAGMKALLNQNQRIVFQGNIQGLSIDHMHSIYLQKSVVICLIFTISSMTCPVVKNPRSHARRRNIPTIDMARMASPLVPVTYNPAPHLELPGDRKGIPV